MNAPRSTSSALFSAWLAACLVAPALAHATPSVNESDEEDLGPRPERAAFVDPVSRQGQRARGLYFSYPFLRRYGADGVTRTLRRARLDAAVIDLKDEGGRVSFQTRVEAFAPQVADRPLDLGAVVRALRARGIYTVGRITCFNDPQLAAREPARAVLDSRPDRQLWTSRNGNHWLDPYNRANHEALIALARDAERLGFDELQLDYIRFPVEPSTRHAVYPAETPRPRHQVLAGFLRRLDSALRTPLGVAVFGVAALREGDRFGLGQSMRAFAPYVEVFSPMLYLNNMRSWGHGARRRAQFLVGHVAGRLRERVGPVPIIRPYLQAFKAGADHWGASFLREQIAGALQARADGYLFWHAGNNYRIVPRATRRRSPLPLSGRDRLRRRRWRR